MLRIRPSLCVGGSNCDCALKIESFRGGGVTRVGRGHDFCFLLYRLNVCNDPAGRGSGEFCALFSLPITTVTKSLGSGGVEGGGGWGGGVRDLQKQTYLHI